MSRDPAELVPAAAPPPALRRIAGAELVLVALIALAVLLPGVWRYSLVDPWETHYGEVARRMLQDDDWVHTDWQNEGFRSKPVLTFWLMAASMKALNVADDGGYSGEMTESSTVLLAIRLPFILFGVLGLVAGWWMLARMAGRRVAYLALLVLGTTPFYVLVARQGITDMTLVGSMIGAIAMFAVANEAGDERLRPLAILGRGRWRLILDHRHLFALIVGGLLFYEAIYYVQYFAANPRLAGIKLGGMHPGWVIAMPMLLGLTLLLLADVPAALAESRWLPRGARNVVGALASATSLLEPTRTSRQVYMLWFYGFLGISVLGKGLPALGIVGIVCFFYILLLNRWRDLLRGQYELFRGTVLLLLIAVPWHVAMWFKDGRRFLQEYFVTHLWNRAAVGVHGERGTFDFYMSQLGYGMHLWAALVPAALAALVLRTRTDTPEGRARFVVATWAVTSVAFFSLVQTKFHHYILPAVPALAMAVAFWLDDVLAGRARRVGLAALIGIGLLLLITNDMLGEEKQWIEMFIYRYDRPWPRAEPWAVDVTDGILALGVAGAIALGVLAIPRLQRLGVVLVGAAGIATAMWAMHVYMPLAGTHWGMRDAVREYYEQREIHGARVVYYGARQLADEWDPPGGPRDRYTFKTFVPDAPPGGPAGHHPAHGQERRRQAHRPRPPPRRHHRPHRRRRGDRRDRARRAAPARVDHRRRPQGAPRRARAHPRRRRRSADRVAAVLARRELLERRRDLRQAPGDADGVQGHRQRQGAQVSERPRAVPRGPPLLGHHRGRAGVEPQDRPAHPARQGHLQDREHGLEQVLAGVLLAVTRRPR